MAEQNSKGNVSSSRTTAPTTTMLTPNTNTPQRIVQNFVLIWVDANIDETKKDCQNTLAQLRSVVNNVNICMEPKQCLQRLNDLSNEKAFIVVSDALGQNLVSEIHPIPQVDTIYIFCGNKTRHEQWAKDWSKIKGVYTEIKPICEALQLAAKQCNEDSIAISFVSVDEVGSGHNLNQLESSFMYTQIFKEILVEMKHDNQAVKDLAKYCRGLFANNMAEIDIINEFEQNYRAETSIWWYTRECFTYQMLNRALRNLEGDTIINMGFFISDLHRQIDELHQKQINSYKGKPLLVYRGQGLLTKDFEKLRKTKGGLMSFNNFLSTSKKREVSLGFAQGALGKTDMVGVLFVMTIDPTISSTPFAAIGDYSYFQTEEEILFSMHTVFRIGNIQQMNKNNALYQVELQLTADDDEQLRILTKRIREEMNGSGWQRMGNLLLTIGQFNKAEELYNILLEQTSDESEKAYYYNQLGYVKNDQGNYKKAIWYYEKAIELYQKTLPPDHPHLATSYNNIGLVYDMMGEYPKALSYYGKSLEIRQKSLPPNHPHSATSYNNIGLVYYKMGQYSESLSYHEKSLEIRQKTLPANHPDLAQSYNNIGLAYYNMGQYSKALSYYEKSLEIWQKTLPSNHPSLAASYNNIGEVHRQMGEYPKAFSFYEKSLEIRQKLLPPNHPDFATSYNNIGLVCWKMREYSKSLSYYEKSLEIRQKTLPANHPDLAQSYNNIGLVYDDMGQYSKALSFYERTLDIIKHSLPPNHPHIQITRKNIEIVKKKMK